MIIDPLTVWNGQFPYDALGPAGITPESSHSDVENASFTLMSQRMLNPRTQRAWNDLRDLQRRLLADVLLYDIDLAAEIRQARARLRDERSEPGTPPEVPAEMVHEPDSFPTQQLIDSLIEFDR